MREKTVEGITAPYNFVPLSGWIFSPEWAAQVSLDIPFREGLSGFMEIEITAHTPLLVGHKQIAGSRERAGEVHFLRIGGRHAIPGTSLKGMLRNVLEIASFGKMRYVDDRRLGIRDIATRRVREKNYQLQNQEAGFLRFRQDKSGQAEIVPCQFAHLWHQDMSRYANQTYPYIFKVGMSVEKKYETWHRLSHQKSHTQLPIISFEVDTSTRPPKAKNLGDGKIQGEIVLTGQISDRGNTPRGGKYRDFVFYNRQDVEILEVTPKVLADFRFIHGEGLSEHKGPWNTFWRQRFFSGKEIPVFFQRDNARNVKSIGLAYMYKLAYEYSIGETIAHTHPLHRSDQYPDFPELLFGKIYPHADQAGQTLKSRVSFGLCIADDSPQEQRNWHETILNGPKSTYFPNYIQQPLSPRLSRTEGEEDYYYRTYMQPDSEIRGWKRYPVRTAKEIALAEPPRPWKGLVNRKVQVKLFPLPENTRFTGKIRFHNLRPEELGGLLWALTWGGNNKLRHSLGMGKSFGFGQVSVRIKGCEIRHNETYATPLKLDEAACKTYMAKFEACMDTAYAAAQSQQEGETVKWQDSEQLVQLTAMADPHHPKATKENLRHMKLERRNNEFATAKQGGWVLPEYHQYTKARDRDSLLFARHPNPTNVKVNAFCPLWLTLKDIGPFRSRTYEIDFTTSNDKPCNLFLLLGPNGQGKTTALEAMACISRFAFDKHPFEFGQEDIDRGKGSVQWDIFLELEWRGIQLPVILSLLALGSDQVLKVGSERVLKYLKQWPASLLKKYGAAVWWKVGFSYDKDSSSKWNSICAFEGFKESEFLVGQLYNYRETYTNIALAFLAIIHRESGIKYPSFSDSLEHSSNISKLSWPRSLYFHAYRNIQRVSVAGAMTLPKYLNYSPLYEVSSEGSQWEESIDNLLLWLDSLQRRSGDTRFSEVVKFINEKVFQNADKVITGVSTQPPQAIIQTRDSAHRLDQLSSGEKNLVQLFIRIMLHSTQNTVVLIDELDMHLHPRWQHHVVNLLQEIVKSYSGLTVITSSHSREILERFNIDSADPKLRQGGWIIEKDFG